MYRLYWAHVVDTDRRIFVAESDYRRVLHDTARCRISECPADYLPYVSAPTQMTRDPAECTRV